jgi:hypothetical protein
VATSSGKGISGEGMLEQHGLVLGPWDAPAGPPPAGLRRTVFDAASGEPLGFIVRPDSGSRWLRWLRPVLLEVYETEDASLVCTFRGPSWARRGWEVCDSDGRRVGMLLRTSLFDGEGYRQAIVQRTAGGGGRFVAPDGLELAAFAPGAQGTMLTFTPAVEGRPFARMALLGATLAAGG